VRGIVEAQLIRLQFVLFGCRSPVQCDFYEGGWAATLPHYACKVLIFVLFYLFFFL